MRERDLKALEFDKVIHLVMESCASEPGRDATAALGPSIEPVEVRARLRATAEMVELRGHSGSIPIHEFVDQRPYLLAAARVGAILGGEALVKVRDFVVASRHVAGFLRSRVERYPHVAALVNNLLAPKELADAMLSALADDGALLDDASPELKRLRTRLRDERAELEARLLRSLNASGMESFVSDYLVTIRNRRFVLPMKLNYAERFEGIVQEANFFAIVIAIQQRSGGNLSEALGNLSRVLRDRKKMKAKIKAMSQEAKASAGIIGALPVAVMVLVYITSPQYITLLWTAPIGRVMLAASAVWMFTGVMVMKKMINFDF